MIGLLNRSSTPPLEAVRRRQFTLPLDTLTTAPTRDDSMPENVRFPWLRHTKNVGSDPLTDVTRKSSLYASPVSSQTAVRPTRLSALEFSPIAPGWCVAAELFGNTVRKLFVFGLLCM